MTAVTRYSGVAGTFPVTFDTTPVGTPTITLYSDSVRTAVAVATAPLAPTANPLVWTATYPATLAAGTYYLAVSAVYTAGQPARVDSDDVLQLTSPEASVGSRLPPLATLEDLEDRLGRTYADEFERRRATAALADASALVRAAAGRQYVDAAGILTAVPDTLVAVTLAAALRGVDNPRGVVQETIGAYSYSRGGEARGGVYLTDDERRDVKRAATGRAGGLQTLTAVRGTGLEPFVEAYKDGTPAPDPGGPASWPLPAGTFR